MDCFGVCIYVKAVLGFMVLCENSDTYSVLKKFNFKSEKEFSKERNLLLAFQLDWRKTLQKICLNEVF